jgi:putative addiction module component (TIGR02574 family)
MSTILIEEVRKLTPVQKMRLAEDLWDDVAAHAAALPVPLHHQHILDARLAAHEADPDSALTLDEFRERLARMKS